MTRFAVTVVMPVYNEAQCIAEVLEDWRGVLKNLGERWRLLAINDGSRDDTTAAMAPFAGQDGFEIIHKPNSGHGPTILMGYRLAAADSEWVFQIDSDNEMKARDFRNVWDMRQDCDALVGIRQDRDQPISRRMISAVSRLTVRVLYGKGVQDVNCPFRLMRSSMLKRLLAAIPEDTFAPNVALSGLMVRAGAVIRNVPIPHEPRRTGEVSIKRWKLLRSAARSWVQTLMIRCRGSSCNGCTVEPAPASKMTDRIHREMP